MTERAFRPPLALVVNDQEWSARSIESILTARGYAVIRAADSRQALDQARQSSPDVILLDLGLPDRSGIETCRILRADPRVSPATPILITTARQTSRRERLEALGAGAWDYVPLPLDSEELLPRLELYVRAKMEADRAHDIGLLDPMTKLYNMRGLLRRLREMTAQATRSERPIACVIMAAETRSGNGAEGKGSGQGPGMTPAVAFLTDVFSRSCRSSDVLGYIREGEFGLLAYDTDSAGARRIAHRLRDSVEVTTRERTDSPVLSLRAGYHSLTVAAEGAAEPEQCLALATRALRRAQADPGSHPIWSAREDEIPPD